MPVIHPSRPVSDGRANSTCLTTRIYESLIRWPLLMLAAVLLLLTVAPMAPAQTTGLLTPTSVSTSTTGAISKATASLPAAGVNCSEQSSGSRTVKALLILCLFVAIASMIATRRLPAMVALPIMAIGIGLCVGLPFIGPNSVLGSIVEGLNSEGKKSPPIGAFRLYEAIIYILFGGMFARFISDAKIAERIVKFTAEFGGEDPYLICLLMALVNVVIFTAGGGLPIIIMIGTVMFPILLSLGVSPVVCGCLLLLSFPIGVYLGPAFWASQATIFDVTLNQSMAFNTTFAAVMGAVLIGFLTIEFLSMKRGPVSRKSVLISLGILLSLLAVVFALAYADRALLREQEAVYRPIRAFIGFTFQAAIWGILAIAVVHSSLCKLMGWNQTIHWNLLTPVLPLLFLLVLGFSWKQGADPVSMIVPAFMAALAYGVITTPGERMVQKLSRTIMDGIADVAAPVILMLGIGMLIAAAMHPESQAVIKPMLAQVIPRTALGFLVFFIIASPFALYRGPLNQHGLGAGIAGVMKDFLPVGGPMGAIVSVGMLQDPTSSQYVWTAGYLKLSMNAMLFKLFFYSVVMMFCGLLLTIHLFFPGGIPGLVGYK